ncbi:hypothetical protein HELRODRAFT_166005 [Helobdella robusta]|uniref:Uncharacterized protein n=1 Tax=Helobdella robusta TaxID=6412 RepID=T1EXK7_HELRO|nr:hypothetical protein HELRODRAFT_166005 [Helobdella robusta]ESN90347.1 hypothetical protein HELRODRAFT_166005 [Helobdella robusta]
MPVIISSVSAGLAVRLSSSAERFHGWFAGMRGSHSSAYSSAFGREFQRTSYLKLRKDILKRLLSEIQHQHDLDISLSPLLSTCSPVQPSRSFEICLQQIYGMIANVADNQQTYQSTTDDVTPNYFP